MSEPSPSVPQAARDLLAVLERYGLHVGRLTGRWMDTELYHTVALEIDAIRHACQRLPGLSSPWVALLIAHAELMHALWQASGAPAGSPGTERHRLLAQVHEQLRRLEVQCMKLAGGPA
jgi:hypothetical protein